MTESGFRCLSINTDMSNRKDAAKGDKLYGAVHNVVTNALGTSTLPSFVAIQEIGPRNGKKLINHCSQHYEGVVSDIAYDAAVLMWRKDRWKPSGGKAEVTVNTMGHFLSVKLQDIDTEETVYLIGTHQEKEGRGFEAHRTLNTHIQEAYRREKADNIVAVGDFNWKARRLPEYYPECKRAFETDVEKSSKSGCIDNVITPRKNANFHHKQVLSQVKSFHHSPIVALYTAKRELI